nr:MAG TPA: tRNA (cytosine(38)-C(5))-methyltransferase [Caudoviricetes sp.]
MSINILVACEESQRVCIEFRKLGFNAFSCDIRACSGDHPEWHIQGDVIKVMQAYDFETMTLERHAIHGWDCMIAFPPCTYLTNTGNRWFNVERYGEKARERIAQRIKAREFFMRLYNANIKHIAIENPIGHINTAFRKPDQIIQPYFFGDPERKSTCLWLKGLPPLT